RAAELEGADRLEVLQLQVDRAVRVGLQAEQRRVQDPSREPPAGRADVVERDHQGTAVPRPDSRARADTSSAAPRASGPTPSDLKTVSSSGERRPSRSPIRTSPSSARMWSGPIPASWTAKR